MNVVIVIVIVIGIVIGKGDGKGRERNKGSHKVCGVIGPRGPNMDVRGTGRGSGEPGEGCREGICGIY